MKNNYFYILFISIFLLVFIISIFFITILYINFDEINPSLSCSGDISYNSEFIWPIPGYTRISSPFGKRNAPTSGASTYHKGIDIPAPPGTELIAVSDGTISFTNFLGGGRIYNHIINFRFY